MDSELLTVYKYGTYYNPAWKHYGSETNVVCDRCKSSNLSVCIGHGSLDLCMMCIHEMSTVRPSQKIMTKMMQGIYRPGIYRPEIATLMVQHMFRPSDDAYDPRDDTHTYMVQNMYNQKW
jgi:hypothetical protein